MTVLHMAGDVGRERFDEYNENGLIVRGVYNGLAADVKIAAR